MVLIDNFIVRWLEEMRASDKWDLSLAEVCSLLAVSETQYQQWLDMVNQNQSIHFDHDTDTRVSLLLGIHKGLAETSPQGYEFDFFKRPNSHPTFAGKSIKAFLLSETDMENLRKVRDLVSSRN